MITIIASIIYAVCVILSWLLLRNHIYTNSSTARGIDVFLVLMPVVNFCTILALLLDKIIYGSPNCNKFFKL